MTCVDAGRGTVGAAEARRRREGADRNLEFSRSRTNKELSHPIVKSAPSSPRLCACRHIVPPTTGHRRSLAPLVAYNSRISLEAGELSIPPEYRSSPARTIAVILLRLQATPPLDDFAAPATGSNRVLCSDNNFNFFLLQLSIIEVI
ncbi:hypothetical protein KSP40_PGU004024 [Platanthera guangdongensis]|uniref:Uncharacterized protein n=1 Tax=Platanthera guangdongensis TaxID=2320717 RepID=A0ABR2N2W0_9ASPA